MKLPFSYKSHFFSPILGVSLLSHTFLLGVSGSLFFTPQFAVKEAPQSVEVILLKEKPEKKEYSIPRQRVIVSEDPYSQKEEVVQRKEKEHQPTPPRQKSVIVPPAQGAMTRFEPDHLRNPSPPYPERAREQNWEGIVVLKVLVGKDGAPLEIKIEKSSGYKILDQSAFKTIHKWKFSPAQVGKLTFSSWIRIPIRFMLVDES